MNPKSPATRANLRFCVAVGAAAGVGPALFNAFVGNLGYLPALAATGLLAAGIAACVSLLMGMVLKDPGPCMQER